MKTGASPPSYRLSTETPRTPVDINSRADYSTAKKARQAGMPGHYVLPGISVLREKRSNQNHMGCVNIYQVPGTYYGHPLLVGLILMRGTTVLLLQ